RCPGHRAGLHGVARARTGVFLRYLRSRGAVPVPAPSVAPPALVTGFWEWMRGQRGSAETTLRQYRAVASALLGRLGTDPARYEAGAVRAAVHEVTGGHGTATARYVAKVARGFLRYLAVAGRCRPGLDAAILPVANWRRASLPRYVSADAVQRAMVRAAVAAPTRGAHLLRHSAATAMLRDGISLPAIAVVLRHRSVETTAHYAKVDTELLRSVAQPWLGGAPC